MIDQDFFLLLRYSLVEEIYLSIHIFGLARTRMTGNNANQAGWHTIDGPMFQCRVPVRYTDLALIGQGAFGVVV